MSGIPSHVRPYCMRIGESATVAYYRIDVAMIHPVVLVIDHDDRLVGTITKARLTGLTQAGERLDSATVEQVCVPSYPRIDAASDIYASGRAIFAESELDILPVVNERGEPVDIFARWQAFFLDHYRRHQLRYNFYAHNLMAATREAAAKGYTEISAIEFGVAGGTGLRFCELYAREAARLSGVQVQVYGFDSGKGLFDPADYRDAPNVWVGGQYAMDEQLLRDSLESAQLVMGDIVETAPAFFQTHSPAPIGVMLVDVDHYRPTVAILDMLKQPDEHFLPNVFMFFDDISPFSHDQGEQLAVREFNRSVTTMSISPEIAAANPTFPPEVAHWAFKLAVCRRFEHPRFATSKTQPRQFGLLQ